MTAQSNAEPQTLRDAAENLLIAIGMGWDLDGCVENLRAALAQSDAEPEYHPDGRRKGRSRLVYDKEKRTIVPESSQSDAEPVAWRWRENRYSLEQYGGRWQGPIGDPEEARWRSNLPEYTVEPLFAAPPRPDASAGLIEAEGLLDARANEFTGYNEKIEQGYRMAAKYLRSRAADRSGK